MYLKTALLSCIVVLYFFVNKGIAQGNSSSIHPVGHWKFNEGSGATAADASGNANPANVVNSSWVSGRDGSGISLAGGSSRLVFPAALSGSGFPVSGSLSFWIKADFSSQNNLNVFDSYRGDNHIFMRTNAAAGALQIAFQQANNNYAFLCNLPVSANVWTHVCVVWDAVNHMGHVYRDGVLRQSSPIVENIFVNSRFPVLNSWSPANQSFLFGSTLNGSNAFNGSLDEIRLYNRCLSQAEVVALNNLGTMPAVDGDAPATPALFAASTFFSSRLGVGWQPTTATDAAGFSLYRNGALYRILTPTTTTLLEEGLDSTATYSYQVEAFDYSGNRSAAANTPGITPLRSPVVVKGDFEADRVSSSDIMGWSQQRPVASNIVVTTEQVKAGNKAVKLNFSYNQWSTANNRAELFPAYTGAGSSELTPNRDWWVELSQYVPASWQKDLPGNADVIWNFRGATGGPSSGTSPLSAQVIGDSIYVYLQAGSTPSANGTQQLLGSFPLVKGAWMDWVIQVNFSYNSGLVRIWRNGNLVVNYTGGTLYPTVNQSNETGPSFRTGLFKPFWGSSATQVSSRIIYIDEIKIGTAMMTPVSYAPPTAQAQPEPGMLGRWKLNEGSGIEVADVSGSGYVASLLSTGWSGGKEGSAVTLTGGSSRMSFPTALSNSGFPTSGSLAFWIKGDFSSQNNLNVFDNYRGDNHIFIRTNTAAGGLQIAFQQANNNYAFLENMPVSANVWTHVCIVWDAVNRMGYVYKDGVLRQSSPLVENVFVNGRFPLLRSWTPANQVFLFGSSLNASNAFNGNLDEIRLYNRCLSQAEVGALNNLATMPVADATAPATPGLFAATAISSTRLGVGWQTVNAGDIAGYALYRNDSLYRILTSTTSNLLEEGLDSNRTYQYRAETFDYSANRSASTAVAAVTPLRSPLVVKSDFEADATDSLSAIFGWSQQRPVASNIVVTTEQARSGNKAVKLNFNYNQWSAANPRAELFPAYAGAGSSELTLNRDWWVELSQYVPASWQKDLPGNADVIWNFRGVSGGPGSGAPPLSAQVIGDSIYVYLQAGSTPSANGTQQLLGSFPLVKGAWMDWVIQVNFSYNSGLVRIWRNGNLVVNYTGGTLYPTVNQSNETGPSFRTGLFKASWGSAATQVSNRTLYIDEIKIGTAMMTPVSYAPPTAQAQPEPGMVGRWKLNEGSGIEAADVSGNGYVASLVNAGWVSGRDTNAVALAGGSSRLNFPTALNGSGFPASGSLAFWIKGDFSNQGDLNVFDGIRNDNHIVIRTNTAVSGLQIAFQQANGSNTWVSNLPVSANVWTHVCVVWDTINYMGHVYHNGSLWTSAPMLENAANAASPVLRSWTPANQIFLFGAALNAANAFTGTLDEIRLYNRCLSQAEVGALNNLATMPIADVTAPATPNLFAATAVSSSRLGVGWQPSTATDLAGYRLYRNGSLYRILTPATSNLLEEGLDSTATYSYQAVAFDYSANRSTATNTIAVTPLRAPMVVKGDFEADATDSLSAIFGWSQQRPTAANIVVTTEQARSGNKAVKLNFSYNQWSTANNRAELFPAYAGAGSAELTLNRNWWVELSQYLPASWQKDLPGNADIIWNFRGAPGGPSSGVPPLSAQVIGDSIYINLQTGSTPSVNGTQQLLGSFPLVRGSWMDWVIQVNFSYNTGLVRIWRNGELVVNYTGGTLYPTVNQSNETGPSFRTGLYKAMWGSVATQVSNRILYVDEVKIGTAMMTPVNYTPPVAQAQPEPGMLGRWKLNEGSGIEAADISGNGHVANLVSTAWTSGKEGKSVVLAGGSSRLTFPTALSNGGFPTSGSLAFWIKGDFSSQNNLNVFDNYRGDNHIFIRTNTAAGGLQIAFQQANNNYAFLENMPVSANVWTHVCVVWDAVNHMGHVYKDGVLRQSSPLVENVFVNGRFPLLRSWTPSNQVFLFGSALNTSTAFNGNLDEIRLYNRCLSQAEVGALNNLDSMPAVDLVVPVTPPLFTATAISASRLNVGWQPSTDIGSGIAGYTLYRNDSLYRILTPTTTTLLEEGLDSNRTYQYKAEAFDYSGNRSTTTNTAALTPLRAPLVLKADFEADVTDSLVDIAGWSQQRPVASNIVVTTEQARSGNKAVKLNFNYNQWSAANPRAELFPAYAGAGSSELTLNRDWWVELSQYVPASWQKDLPGNADVIWNFRGVSGGPGSGAPPLSAQVIGDSIYVYLQAGSTPSANGTQQLLGSFPLVKGAWMDWVIQVNFSYNAGLVRIWRNGNLVVNYTGGTLYPTVNQSNETGPSFRTGLFKASWGSTATQVSNRTLYIDEIKIGTAMMTPVSYAPPTAQAQPEPGMVGRWKLNEGSGIEAADVSGNGYVASLVNAGWVSGRDTNAVALAGGSSRLNFPTALNGNGFPASGSLAFWIKGDFSSQNNLNVFDATRNDNHIVIRTNTAVSGLQIAFQQANGSNTWVSNLPVSANVWTHVCVVWDTTNYMGHVYRNGSLWTSAPMLENAANAASPVLRSWTPANQVFLFGAALNAANAFTGTLDEIRLYNRCLSQAEVGALNSLATMPIADVTAPATPNLFAATAVSSSRLGVGWQPSTATDLAGYRLYRNGSLYRILTPATSNLLEEGLDSTATYSYQAVAFDYSANRSTATNTIAVNPLRAPMVVKGDFEADATDSLSAIFGWSQQRPTAANIVVTTEQVRSGNKAVKLNFSYNQWSTANNRAELFPAYAGAGSAELTLNRNWWVELSQYLPASWQKDLPGNADIIWNFRGAPGGPSSGVPPLSAQVIGDSIYINLQTGSTPSVNGTQQLLGSFPLVRGSWMDWVIQVNFSYNTGLVRIWRNGELVVNYTGGTLYPTINQSNETGPSFRTGLYKAMWGSVATQVSNCILYVDEIKIGTAMMTPVNYTPPVAQAQPEPGMLGRWKLNENTGIEAADVSGNGHVANLVSTAWTSGKEGKSVVLAGGSSRLTFPTALSNGGFPTSGSLAFWIKGDFSSQNNLNVFDNYRGDNHIFIRTNTAAGGLQIAFQQANNNYAFLENMPVSANVWTHVCIVWDAVNHMGHVYKDGVLRQSSPLVENVFVNGRFPLLRSWTPANQVFLFGSALNTSTAFNGNLDEIRLYNRCLSQAEVGALNNLDSMPAADLVVPVTPPLFTATAISASRLNVGWQPSTDIGSGIAGYTLYRNDSLYRILIPATSNLLEEGLDSNRTYQYKAEAFDYSGNRSTTTNTAVLTPLRAPLVLKADFEADVTDSLVDIAGWSQQRPTASNIVVTTEQARSGNKAVKLNFNYNQWSAANPRAELFPAYTGAGSSELTLNRDWWVELSQYVPASWQKDLPGNADVIWNFRGVSGGPGSGAPPLSAQVIGDSIYVYLQAGSTPSANGTQQLLGSFPLVKGAWMDWVIQVNFSYNAGLVRIWRNGNLVVNYTGGTLYPTVNQSNETGPSFRTGLFKASWGSAATQVSNRTLYIDEIKIGTAMMTPVSYAPPTAQAQPEPGMLGRWKLNEGSGIEAADVSGNGYVASLVNTGWVSGRDTNAVALAGGSSRLNFPTALNGSGFPASGSLAFWIKGDFSSQNNLNVFDATRNDNHIVIRTNTAVGGLQIAFQQANGSNTWVSNLPVSANVWTHVCVVWDTTNYMGHVYRNGSLWTSAPMLENAANAASPVLRSWTPANQVFLFGAALNAANAFTGTLDEIRLYNRCLSQAEVGALNNLATMPIADATAPATPNLFAATAVSSSRLGVGWQPSTATDLAGYRLYRNGSLYRILTPATSNLLEEGLDSTATYSYQAVAFDYSANRSVPTAVAAVTPLRSPLVVKGDFEADATDSLSAIFGWSQQRPTAANIVVTTEQARSGNKAVKLNFSYNQWSTTNNRAELFPAYAGAGSAELTLNRNWWVELSQYLPASWQKDLPGNADIIWNFRGAPGGPSSGVPPLSAQVIGDSIYINLQTGSTPSVNGTQQLLGSFPLVRGSWMDWVIQVNFSYNTGLVRIWRNGELVVNYTGGTLYPTVNQSNETGPSFRTGLYKAMWGSAATQVSNRILYVDEIKIGTAMMTPVNYTPPVAQAQPEPGMLGRWKLNENTGIEAADVSGNGHVANLISSGWSSGKEGSSAALTTSASRLSFPAQLSGSGFPTSGSLAFWIKGDFSNQNNLNVFDNYRGDNHIFIRTNTAAGGLQIAFQQANNNYAFLENMPVSANVWTHVCIVWDAVNHMGYVYKDGVLRQSSPLVENVFVNGRFPLLRSWTPANQVFLFGSALNTSNAFNGNLDEIRLYNRCLSQAEVGALNNLATMPMADVTAPATPELFATTRLTATRGSIGWQPSSDVGSGIAGYVLYRNDSLYRLVLAPGSSQQEEGLDSTRTYSYRVEAFDYSGNRSAQTGLSQMKPLNPPMVFGSDFEGDASDSVAEIAGWSQQEPSPTDILVTTEQARSGNKAVKFSINYNQWSVNSLRSEILPSNIGPEELTLHKDWWIELSQYVPSNWQTDLASNPDVIWQFHGAPGGPADDSPPLSAQIIGDSVYISLRTSIAPTTNGIEQLIGSFPLVKGAWMDWVLQVNFSYNSGLVRIWRNGNLIVNYSGPTLYPTPTQSNERGTYFKAGIYKWAWGTVPTQTSNRTLYVDDVRIGTGMMTPVSYAPPVGQEQKESGLIGRWKLNENTGIEAADVSGNGYVASIVSSGWTSGKEGSGVSLTAGSSRLSFPAALSGSKFPSNGSLSFWIKGDFSSQNNQNVFDGYRDDNHIFIRSNAAVGGLQFAFQQANNNYAFLYNMPVSANVWTHICVVWDAVNHMGYVYKDGILRQSSPIVENVFVNSRFPILSTWAPSNQLFLFGSSLNASNAFNGNLDEIRLYNRCLSQAEVGALNNLDSMPTIDATAPAVSTLFAATAISSSRLGVGWQPAAATDLAGYRLYRNGSLYRILPATNSNLLEEGLDSTATYSYRVAAFDYSANRSAMTNPAVTNLLRSPVVIKGDFEADATDSLSAIFGWSQQRPAASNIVVTTEQARSGNKAVKLNFNYNQWSAANPRAELFPAYIGAGSSELTLNRDWWVELSQYVPASWQKDLPGNADVIWNFRGVSGGPGSGAPPLSAQVIGDSIYIYLQAGSTPSANGTQQLLGSFPLVKGAWMDWVIQVNFSYNAGLVRIWRNGNLVVNYTGGTLYPTVNQSNETGPSFRTGLFKASWGSTATQVSNRTLYIDEIKIGTAMMTPVSYAPPTAQAQPEPGMLGRWKLNEGSGIEAADVSGNGYVASLVNAGWVSGRDTNAVALAGGSSRLNFPTALNGSGFPASGSLAFWIKGDFSSQNNLNVFDATRNDNHIVIRTNTAAGGLQIAFQQANGSNTWVSNLPVSANVWTHVCVVWDTTNYMGHVYRNGSLWTSAPMLENAANAASPVLRSWTPANQVFLFGAALNAANAFTGTLDEIRLYNRCLSQAEVGALNSLTTMPIADATAPATPNLFAATAVSSNRLGVGWQPSTATDLAGYRLYRNGSLYRILTPATSNLLEEGLDSTATYSYQAVAFDYSANRSTATNTIAVTPLRSPLVVKGDFEADATDSLSAIFGWSQQRPTAANIVVTTEQARSGNKAVKLNFSYNQWSTANNRAELFPAYAGAGSAELTLNRNWWVELSQYLPASWQKDLPGNADIIWNFRGAPGGPSSGVPPLSAQVIGDSIYINLQTGSTPSVNGTQQLLGSFPLVRGSWMDWVIQVNFSYNTGLVRIWRNGELVVNYTGGTLYPTVNQSNETGPSFRTGLYKAMWGSAATQVSNRILYVDDLKIGTAMMTPVNYTPPVAQAQPEPGMLGRWKLNENTGIEAADVSGNNHVANLISSGWSSGKEGSSAALTASASRLSFPAQLSGSGFPTSGSLTFWIKGDFSNQNNLNVFDNYRGDNHIFIRTNTAAGGLQIAFQQANNNYAFLENMPVSANVWTHVCIVWDAVNHMGYVYKDGVLRQSSPLVENVFVNGRFPLLRSWTPANQVFLFGSALNTSTAFNGNLDEIRLYNRCLSQAEVGALNNLTTMPMADVTVPATPELFATTRLTATRGSIGWQPSSDVGSGIAGYVLYRNDSLYRLVLAPGSSQQEEGLDSTRTYSYRVEAFDYSGNRSAQTGLSQMKPLNPPMVFGSDFEGDASDSVAEIAGWSQQEPSPTDILVTTEQVRRGNKSVKLNFNASQWSTANNRVELFPAYTGSGSSELALNRDWWVELSQYIPASWQKDLPGNADIIWNFRGAPGGPSSGVPPLSAQVIGDSIYINLQAGSTPSVNGTQQLLGSFPLVRGNWMDWVIQVNFSYNAGIVRIWRNGELVVNYTGGTLYPTVNQTSETGPSFRTGLYKASWGSAATQVSSRVIYVDDIKIGTGMMTPVNYEPPIAHAQPEAGMLGRWMLNEGKGIEAADVSGNGNIAHLISSGWTNGKEGSAMMLAGSSSRLSFPAQLSGSGFPTSGSLSFWIKGDFSSQNNLNVFDSYRGDNHVFIRTNMATGGLQIAFQQANNNYAFLENLPVNANEWTHICVIWDAVNQMGHVYKNGILRQSSSLVEDVFFSSRSTALSGWQPSSQNFVFGSSLNTPNSFVGKLDDIRLYGYCLSAEEIQNIYHASEMPMAGIQHRIRPFDLRSRRPSASNDVPIRNIGESGS